MNKIYQVLTSFEGHPVGKLIVGEPTQRLEALVASHYLADVTEPVNKLADDMLSLAEEFSAAMEAEKRASPKRVRKE